MGYETDLKLFIDGVWKSGEGRESHDVVNPVTASAIAEVPYATKDDLEEALEASNRSWPEWRSTVSESDANATWDHIAHSPNASIAKAQRLLGYQPRYSSLQAVYEALQWLIVNGIVQAA